MATASSLLNSGLLLVDIRLPQMNPANHTADALWYLILCLDFVAFVLFVLGLGFGIAGRRFWQGWVGMGLVAISPVWLYLGFVIVCFAS